MTREEYVKSIRDTAEEYFRSGTYFCSEAVLQTINDALGKPFSDEIVRMASSFPVGMGKAQCLCGAVSGGEMALGIVYGRVKGQPMDPRMFEVAKGLHDFVKERYKSTCCRVMTREWAGDNFMSEGRKKHCIEITGAVTEWVANTLLDDGKLVVPAA